MPELTLFHWFSPYAKPSCTIGILVIVSAVGVACVMGSHPMAEEAPMSIEALFAYCGLPIDCGPMPSWEGRTICLEGYLDSVNIFDKQRYPQLPYEKFRIIDRRGRSVEVWLKSGNSPAVFKKLAGRPSDRVVVRGRLAGIKMPTNHKCTLGIKVWIDEAEQIQFETN